MDNINLNNIKNRKLPYWVRGLIVGVILTQLFFVLFAYLFKDLFYSVIKWFSLKYIELSNCLELSCALGYLIGVVFAILIFYSINIILFSVIGAIVGGVIGKIKSRKQENSSPIK